ncbi:MAG: rod shape determining protein RodA [Chloroflexi bacterium]|nr:MAG: rod shape determining protein RodA [Chloroflexota bacterium]MBA4375474.1 rod shape-determining protein RodA [Anaerolinea sp.]
MFKRELWRNFDFWLFGAVIFLIVFGIVMIRSAIAGNIELEDSVRRQATFAIIGLGVMLAFALLDYHYWRSLSKLFYIFTVTFLGVILVVGKTSFGAQRWLEVGLVNIQPAEIAKIVLILVLADYFAKQYNKEKNIKWILISLAIVAGIVVQILLQPNLSTSILLFVIWFSMLWISGLPPKYVIYLALVGIILGVAAFPFLEGYQQQRILSFIFPDPNARHGNSYNVEQALITIGSGGFWGQGYGHGTQVQLRFLKVRSTDFIFSAMAEEFGFIGTIMIVALLVFVIIRCLRAARISKDHYGAMIAYGFATLIFFQTIVNIGVNLRLIPVTGQTLPFVSYGGSSLLSLMLGIGLIESVLMHQKK